jgi:hypothetical protein
LTVRSRHCRTPIDLLYDAREDEELFYYEAEAKLNRTMTKLAATGLEGRKAAHLRVEYREQAAVLEEACQALVQAHARLQLARSEAPCCTEE